MIEKIPVAEMPGHWPQILAALRSGEREFLVIEGAQIQAVIISHALYRRLAALADREERRRHALALPLPAAESPADWEAGFETLERASARFTDVSDDEMDVLFGSILDEIRSAAPA